MEAEVTEECENYGKVTKVVIYQERQSADENAEQRHRYTPSLEEVDQQNVNVPEEAEEVDESQQKGEVPQAQRPSAKWKITMTFFTI